MTCYKSNTHLSPAQVTWRWLFDDLFDCLDQGVYGKDFDSIHQVHEEQLIFTWNWYNLTTEKL